MTASDWAAWLGAVTGVFSLAWQIVRWYREGPRLLVRVAPNMLPYPDDGGGPRVLIMVTNIGTVTTTLTHLVLVEFSSWYSKRRFRPAKSWLTMHDPTFGHSLPHELNPGQQFMGGIRRDASLGALISGGKLHVGIYHAFAPTRPVLAHVEPSTEKETT